MKVGDQIYLVENPPEELAMVHKNGRYTVDAVDDAGDGITYVTIQDDTGNPISLLADMFAPVAG